MFIYPSNIQQADNLLLAVLLFTFCISLPPISLSVFLFVNIHIYFVFSIYLSFLAASDLKYVTLPVFIFCLYLLFYCFIFLNRIAFIFIAVAVHGLYIAEKG